MGRVSRAGRPGADGGAGTGPGNGAARAGDDDGAARRGLDAELADLPPEQLALYVEALALALRKRRLMLAGYLGAALVVLLGQVIALVIWAHREPGSFIGWIFLVPLAAAGGLLVATARAIRGPARKPAP